MPGDSLPSTTRDRFLPDPGVRSINPDRHPVVGVILDQRRVVASARVHRSAQRAHDGHTKLRHQPDSAACVLHQGHRRLDDCLSRVRVLCPARVRVRQRGDAQWRADSYADRAHRRAATNRRRRSSTSAKRKLNVLSASATRKDALPPEAVAPAYKVNNSTTSAN